MVSHSTCRRGSRRTTRSMTGVAVVATFTVRGAVRVVVLLVLSIMCMYTDTPCDFWSAMVPTPHTIEPLVPTNPVETVAQVV